MATLGFVGLGQMGSRMVPRLLAAGYAMTGYNRTKAKAEASDVVFSMLADPAAVRAATEGDSGKIYIDMNTTDPTLILNWRLCWLIYRRREDFVGTGFKPARKT